MFSNRDLVYLLVPLILEQLLTSLMGMIDTVMVSNISSAAISAVSLVDSINILVLMALAALATGGTIVVSQYIGSENVKKANEAARQIVLCVTVISVALSIFCLVFRQGLLSIIFGSVEQEVMDGAMTYFFYTALSFPFLALYNAGSSIFRAQRNTKLPLLISVLSNVINVVGNYFLIFIVKWGIAGAAIATLFSRVILAVIIMIALRSEDYAVNVRDYFSIRPNKTLIVRILKLGIPSGIENSMFQFGKLAIQSTVSTLGTIAIAAQAMTNILENLNGMAALAVGIGMMTVVGQCLGAGKKEEAVYYIKKMTVVAEVICVISCILVYLIAKPVTILGGMEKEAAKLCMEMVFAITIVKPIMWTIAFVPAYGMRAAGDVKFSMISSMCIMWLCRVILCIVLCRYFHFGPMGVWIAMFTDWTVRAIVFGWRFYSKRWLSHQVI
ncbi:MAG: MATE family efflux transporter [Bacillota bacterium]|nr:MATE family efflux transporter [Bacillota bacterium]